MYSLIQLCIYSVKLYDPAAVRHKKCTTHMLAKIQICIFIYIHVFINKVNVTQVVHTHWKAIYISIEQTDKRK